MNRHLKAGVVTSVTILIPLASVWSYDHYPKITAIIGLYSFLGLLIFSIYYFVLDVCFPKVTK